MSEYKSFYTLLNLEKACPRRIIFRLKGIKGIYQYFHARKRYEHNRIYQYLTDKFHLDTSKISSHAQIIILALSLFFYSNKSI